MSFIRTCLSFFSIFRGSLAWPGAIGIRTSTRRTGKELFRSCAFNESRRARRGSSFLLSLDTFVFFVKLDSLNFYFKKNSTKGVGRKKSFFQVPAAFFGIRNLKIRPRYPTAPRADCVEASKECVMLKAQARHNLSGKGCIWKRFLVPAQTKSPQTTCKTWDVPPHFKCENAICNLSCPLFAAVTPGSCGASKRHR